MGSNEIKFYISEISKSRKEIKIDPIGYIGPNYYNVISGVDTKNRLQNYYINFGSNKYFQTINWMVKDSGLILKLISPLDSNYELGDQL